MKPVDALLKKKKYAEIWEQYCGFLDLSLEKYMTIQKRLLSEQMRLWSSCALGQSILKGKHPKTLEEFRRDVPLTAYEDYADVLLLKQDDMLPEKPLIWIQTTWEGGKHPIKLAPYTRGMLDTFRDNVVTCELLCTSRERGQFKTRAHDKILYGLAPLPYATGLLPVTLSEAVSIEFLPPVEEAVDMTFSQRNKAGFKLAMKKGGIDYFFGLGSVAYAVSHSLSSMSGGGGIKSLFKCDMRIAMRLLRAKYRCKKENRELMPKDLFRLKGFMVAGTDNRCYKDDLERLWGVRPMELFAGTEPSLMGTETWTRDGMYFFPDTCFYEFIPESDMRKDNPRTYLMDEVVPGEKYELVITVLRGGAFARYRVGDIYRCVGTENAEDNTHIPRFEYIDRVPEIIDIGGFTRISESEIRTMLELSGLGVADWIAAKEFGAEKKPYMHLYVELTPDTLVTRAVTEEILREQMGVYFRYIDRDYRDLKKILGVDPLHVTVLPLGTFERYRRFHGEPAKMNPSPHVTADLLAAQEGRERNGKL